MASFLSLESLHDKGDDCKGQKEVKKEVKKEVQKEVKKEDELQVPEQVERGARRKLRVSLPKVMTPDPAPRKHIRTKPFFAGSLTDSGLGTRLPFPRVWTRRLRRGVDPWGILPTSITAW